MRTGLVLGKFAPLHHGHQWLIEYALARVDHLIIMIYACGELIDVSLSKRAAWIRQLYPQVEVLEAPDGPQEMGDTPEIKQKQEFYILTRLGNRRVTHFFCSEFYGEHVSRALSAQDCRVDESRNQVPISATQIRQDYFSNRHWLHPLVYRDLIKKVVFLGAPSTGKTTLARYLAERFNTQWMPEYGRDYWEQHQVERRLTLEQLLEIARIHLELEEEKIQESNRLLFVDTNALTTYQFSLYYHGTASKELEVLAEHCLSRYDFTFLCGDDIPYENTWDRSGSVQRQLFQEQIKQDLTARKISYIELHGDLSVRAERVSQALANSI